MMCDNFFTHVASLLQHLIISVKMHGCNDYVEIVDRDRVF